MADGAGIQMRIWPEDPSAARESELFRPVQVSIDREVRPGPQDDQIVIRGLAGDVGPNQGQDFLYDEGTAEFDAVHTYAVIRKALDMYRDDLPEPERPWHWNRRGNNAPLNVYLYAGAGLNAFYHRSRRALYFLRSPRRKVFTCRSFDIVAHETGHAVLDTLQPGWWESSPALHESFGDLTAIFLLFHDPILSSILAERLQKNPTLLQRDERANFVATIAPALGRARGRDAGLRNIVDLLTLSDVPDSNSAHSTSRVFTGAVYDILAQTYKTKYEAHESNYGKDVDTLVSTALREAGQTIRGLLLGAIKQAPQRNATFRHVAEAMGKLAEEDSDARIVGIIKDSFTEREIFGHGARRQQKIVRFTRWCDTLPEADGSSPWPGQNLPLLGRPPRATLPRSI